MKKTLSLLALSAFITFGAAQAYANEGHGGPQGGPHGGPGHFKEADTNHDGFLTRTEMEAVQKDRMDKMFAHADTDKDGKLSQAELKKGREDMRQKMREHFKNKKGEKLNSDE